MLVCDQGRNNQSSLKKLGATIDHPFIEVNGKIIYCIYDVPHLIKSTRNNILMNGYFVQDEKIITFTDVRTVYASDRKGSRSTTLPKLTKSHIYSTTFERQG